MPQPTSQPPAHITDTLTGCGLKQHRRLVSVAALLRQQVQGSSNQGLDVDACRGGRGRIGGRGGRQAGQAGQAVAARARGQDNRCCAKPKESRPVAIAQLRIPRALPANWRPSPATAATWRTKALEPTRMPASAEMRGGMSVIESPMYTAVQAVQAVQAQAGSTGVG